ncbi:hypothetical protein KJ951_03510 [Patescibacteria group bacterium]|nr:hypothetical protein [Patescibacteria group bacterium]MBU1703445.1 hypothetical protein [Patescibacteria group bacterium]
MNLTQFGKIVSPVLSYILLLLLYFNFRGINDFDATRLNWYLGLCLMFLAPVFLLFWLIIRNRKIIGKPRRIHVFLISSVPGLFPGAFIAYGFWQMGHAKYFSGLVRAVLELSLPSALIFGLFGLLIDFVLVKIKPPIA